MKLSNCNWSDIEEQPLFPLDGCLTLSEFLADLDDGPEPIRRPTADHTKEGPLEPKEKTEETPKRNSRQHSPTEFFQLDKDSLGRQRPRRETHSPRTPGRHLSAGESRS